VITGKQNLNVNQITIGWVVSQGQKKIQLSAQQFVGQQLDAVSLIKGQGFTNVTKTTDSTATGQPEGTIIKITPADGLYATDQQIVVFVAPKPPPPPTTQPTTPACDSATQDCNTSPTTQPTGTTATSSSGGPSSNPSCQIGGIFGCPSTPTSTKHGG